MCGILGMANFSASRAVADDARVRRALAMIAHRGPDDEGVRVSPDRDVVLGHRRLSIIDTSSAGHQPMANADSSLWIVYNGEVYNFPELRAELEALGHRFTSRTDTEVILRGYQEFGEAIVPRLRGMFAFAIHDMRRRLLFLARDRMGIKPLYYCQADGAFVFGSEIRPVVELAGIEKRLNAPALREYLAFGKVYPPATMFEGVMKLPAAHTATVTADGMALRAYWNPYQQPITRHDDRDVAAWAADVRELLAESVSLRMISDVPVGVFLSGGVDSTANVAMMSRAGGGNVHTFTAGFEGAAAYDEREFARDAAAHFGCRHEELEISRRDLADKLPAIASYLDEPVADPTVIPIFFLSRMARASGAIVILNGDGGDELFAGYRKHLRYMRLAPYWRGLNMLPRWTRAGLAAIGRGVGLGGVASDLLDRAARDVEMYVGATGPLKGTPPFAEVLHQPDDLYGAVRAARREFLRQRRGTSYAEWLAYWGLRSEVENVFLYRADRMGMANSIEIRVPFLDHHMVELALQMPQRLKYQGGETKFILKKALEGIVPDRFLYRRKQGFCVPLREWTGGLIDDQIRRVLPRMSSDWGTPSRQFIDGALGLVGGAADRDGALSWMLFNLAVWYEQWF